MNKYFVEKAEKNMPRIYKREVYAKDTVQIVEDKNAWFGCRAKIVGGAEDKILFVSGDSFILDFGEHCVGKLSFCLRHDVRYLDAPVRLRLRFGETPYELYRDNASYHGRLCRSWLQEEIINLDDPGMIELPRRYTFRYLQVEIVAAHRPLRLTDFKVTAETSADLTKLVPLPDNTDPMLKRIDEIAAATLRDCMQTSYEDGPKRDRRLWTGDLRLQALTDFYLFQNDKLARRCLYLFASCEDEGKYLPGCLYQKPTVFYDDGMGIMDYALLFVSGLCDYCEYLPEDEEVPADLFPVAQRQIELALTNRNEEGIVTLLDGWNSFIDWAPDIQRITSEQGVLMYALEKMIVLAEKLGKTDVAENWKKDLAKVREDAMKVLFDGEKRAFVNRYDQFQYSVQSQVWMILGGAVSGEEGRRILTDALASSESLKPVTPYMHHYVVEAMVKLGMMDEALAYIKSYWGGMVEKGADTFWEVYVPEDVNVSPYGDILINSFCHAWSCSPSYFIRKYFVDWNETK